MDVKLYSNQHKGQFEVQLSKMKEAQNVPIPTTVEDI